MTEQRLPNDSYLTTQFAAVQARIAADDRRRQRRTRVAWVGGGVLASIALTGGAIAVVQATGAREAVTTCFEETSMSAASTETGDGGPAATSMSQRVSIAEEQCALAWKLDAFDSQSDLKTKHSIPELFTCVLDDGRLAVFPVDGKTTCTTLELREP